MKCCICGTEIDPRTGYCPGCGNTLGNGAAGGNLPAGGSAPMRYNAPNMGNQTYGQPGPQYGPPQYGQPNYSNPQFDNRQFNQPMYGAFPQQIQKKRTNPALIIAIAVIGIIAIAVIGTMTNTTKTFDFDSFTIDLPRNFKSVEADKKIFKINSEEFASYANSKCKFIYVCDQGISLDIKTLEPLIKAKDGYKRYDISTNELKFKIKETNDNKDYYYHFRIEQNGDNVYYFFLLCRDEDRKTYQDRFVEWLNSVKFK